VTVPFHSGAILHPKIVKQSLETIDDAGQSSWREQDFTN
jgi:predicted RNA binding protein YcfA (HicA-like mRNA interferase family)